METNVEASNWSISKENQVKEVLEPDVKLSLGE